MKVKRHMKRRVLSRPGVNSLLALSSFSLSLIPVHLVRDRMKGFKILFLIDGLGLEMKREDSCVKSQHQR